MQCPQCGKQAEETSQPCPHCGADLSARASGIRLSIKIGYLSGEHCLDKPVIALGRSDPSRNCYPDVDLSGDDAVSRFHAEIRCRDGQYFLVDVGSVNGTRLAGKEIPPLQEQLLCPGDEIALGEKTTIKVVF